MFCFTSCNKINEYNNHDFVNNKLYNSITGSGCNLEATREAIASGADINELPKEYMEMTESGVRTSNPLLIAISYGPIEIAEELVILGADVNYKDSSNRSVLMHAVYSGRSQQFCKLLIENGADINYTDPDNNNVLDMFLDQCNYIEEHIMLPMFKFLIENGCNVSKKTIMQALKPGPYYSDHYEIVSTIVKKVISDGKTIEIIGVDEIILATILNDKEAVGDFFNKNSSNTKDEKLIAMFCSFNDNVEAIKSYIENGGDINTKDDNENTLLMIACRYGSNEVIDYLLKNGADVNKKNIEGETAISQASLYGQTEVVHKLLNYTSNIYGQITTGLSHNFYDDVLINAGRNGDISIWKDIIQRGYEIDAWHEFEALLLATEYHQKKFCTYLFSLGISPDIENENETCLSNACWLSNVEMVEFLINSGADVNGNSIKGLPILTAAEYANTETIKILIEKGADINVTYKDYEYEDDVTPLMHAIYKGSLKSVELLLDSGADLHHVSKMYGNVDALLLAVERHSLHIVETLIKAGAEIRIKDEYGNNAYEYAKLLRDKEIIALLEKYFQ